MAVDTQSQQRLTLQVEPRFLLPQLADGPLLESIGQELVLGVLDIGRESLYVPCVF